MALEMDVSDTDSSIDDALSLQDHQQLSRVAEGITSIESVPKLVTARGLQSLCLHGNSITRIAGLTHLTALQELVLSCNAISSIGNGLRSLQQLQKLDLTSNRLTSTDGLVQLMALRHLVRAAAFCHACTPPQLSKSAQCVTFEFYWTLLCECWSRMR